MRATRAVVVLLASVAASGCFSTGEGAASTAACDPSAGADRSVTPYDHGVTLHTVRDGTRVEAWGCNESGGDRWVLQRQGGCPGSWSWTYRGPDDPAASAAWPPGGNHAACDDAFLRIPAGRAVQHTFDLTAPHEPRGEWIIRLQVYTQPQMLEDAGGGPVHAVYTT